ncbi:MAG: XRE family transcriptional regulator [Sphaerospermopsis sp. SIO1G1]|nr:XRE family transcriptional regulator [Sphaerospermopsis sp. SIO1G1]
MIKEVPNRLGVAYTTLKNYAKSPGLASLDVTSLHELARMFDVIISNLHEIVQEQ